MSDRKRSLDLLPEILPAPPPLSESGPRQRALESLRRLAAAAGTAATISGCSSYAVVDPIPPPSRCAGLADSIDATVTRKTATTVVLTMSKPRFNGATYVIEPPTVTGGMLVSSDIKPDAATFEIEVPSRPTSDRVFVSLSMMCPNGPSHVSAYFLPEEVRDAGTIAVRVVDEMY
jgi:hypothetical protein